jgi:hypothetical protein
MADRGGVTHHPACICPAGTRISGRLLTNF